MPPLSLNAQNRAAACSDMTSPQTLDEHLNAMWDELARAHTYGVDRGTFLSDLRETVVERAAAAGVEAVEVLERMAVEDLYLARGCAAGNAAARRDFVKHYGAEVERLGVIFSTRSVPADDARQELLIRLFTVRPDGSGPFQTYRGSSSLRGWLRVAMRRVVIDLNRGKWRNIPGTGNAEELSGVAEGGPAHADTVVDQLSAAVVQRALGDVLATLSEADRTLLRRYHLEGCTFGQLGREHAVDPSTVHRWLHEAHTKVRKRLSSWTRSSDAADRPRLRPEEVSSLIELVADIFQPPP